MKKQKKKAKGAKCECNWKCDSGHCGGATYGLGFIGAAIYYISAASGFGAGVVGFLKALVWPVFLILESLKFLGA